MSAADRLAADAVHEANRASGYTRYSLHDGPGREVILISTAEFSGTTRREGTYQLPHELGDLERTLVRNARTYRQKRPALIARLRAAGQLV